MNANPIVSEILSGAILSIEMELEEYLARSWRCDSLRDGNNFSVKFYDKFGRSLTSKMLGTGIDSILAKFRKEEIKPGDIFIQNDSFLSLNGIGDSSEICISQPLFSENELISFIQVRAQHDDLGGISYGGTSDLSKDSFHEGIIIEPIKIKEGQKIKEDIFNFIVRNSRQPDLLRDDLYAKISVLNLGGLQLKELIKRYGKDELKACFSDLLKESKDAFENLIEENIKDGEWKVKKAIAPGHFEDKNHIALTLLKSGKKLTLNFIGSSWQSEGPINCPLSGNGTKFITRLLTPFLLQLESNSEQRNNIRVNDGACKIFDIELPETKSIVTPDFPAPTSLRLLTISSIISGFNELLFKASSGKTRVGFENLNTFSLFTEYKEKRSSLFRESISSGTGASFNSDGVSSVLPLSGTGRISIEITENRYPLQIIREELRVDSGGHGKFRGGLGITKEYLLKEDSLMSLARNNDQTSTSGKLGGYNGYLSEQSITKKGRGKNSLPSLISSKKINKGEHLIIQASGGGGYGNPVRRSIELVKKDVLRGYISRSTAFKNYGVVFKNTKNFEIDEKSTKKERNRLSKKKK
ncbi:MAG: hydantoinase B/oxoprolinase family protein [bacterium]